MKNGVPFSKAFGDDSPLEDFHRLAMAVVFGTWEGGDFDWDRLEWKPKKEGR